MDAHGDIPRHEHNYLSKPTNKKNEDGLTEQIAVPSVSLRLSRMTDQILPRPEEPTQSKRKVGFDSLLDYHIY